MGNFLGFMRKMRSRYLVSLFFLAPYLAAVSQGDDIAFSKQSKEGYFEGALHYVLTHYATEQGGEDERLAFPLVATEDRLMFPSLSDFPVFDRNAPPGVESLLVRNDANDIILFGDEMDAFRLKQIDMTLLGIAMNAMSIVGVPLDFGDPEDLGVYQLRTFKASLWSYQGKHGLSVDVYFSRDYKVNWGLLSRSWLFGDGGLKISGIDELLELGVLPVRIEAYRDERKLASINLMKVEERSVQDAEVSYPQPKILHPSTSLLKGLLSSR